MRVGGIKTKTLKLVFDTSPLGMQHSDVQSKDRMVRNQETMLIVAM